jgi:hypothetical protein
MITGSGRPGEISIGELVEAMHALRPSAAAAERIAASLGLGWTFAARAATVDAGDTPVRPVDAPPSAIPKSEAPARFAALELLPVRRATKTLELTPGAQDRGAPGPLAPPNPQAAITRPLYRPLFQDRLWRSLVRAMLATSTTTNTIDLPLILKHASTGRPIERLPWRLKATLRRGVVLILDRSASMQPFWRDERELVERCGRVIGSPGVRAYWVESDPRSDADAQLRWLQPEPEVFQARTPVMIVSDFDLGKEIVPRWPLLTPWLPVIERARAAGAPVFALVPIARSLWPTGLIDAIPHAIPWDDDTTTTTIRQALSSNG